MGSYRITLVCKKSDIVCFVPQKCLLKLLSICRYRTELCRNTDGHNKHIRNSARHYYAHLCWCRHTWKRKLIANKHFSAFHAKRAMNISVYFPPKQQTIGAWRVVFFVTIALYVIEIIMYTLFGSGVSILK